MWWCACNNFKVQPLPDAGKHLEKKTFALFYILIFSCWSWCRKHPWKTSFLYCHLYHERILSYHLKNERTARLTSVKRYEGCKWRLENNIFFLCTMSLIKNLSRAFYAPSLFLLCHQYKVVCQRPLTNLPWFSMPKCPLLLTSFNKQFLGLIQIAKQIR